MGKPKIRFKGFDNDWEQRKLGEIITEYKETVDSDCTLPILTSSKTEGVILQEEHFGRKQQHDITGYNILPRNYCTYRNRSDGVDFTFNINKCCDKGIISKFYPVFSGNNSDVFFLSLVLNNSEEVVHEIAYTCTGTGQKVLSFLDLQKMKVRVPGFDEQKKIAAYFDDLDHLITLHQRKCEDTKKLKKYMLQKMFPQNGSKVPEIRFKGFTDDWEQRKLGDVLADMYNGQTPSRNKAEFWNGEISWLSSGELNRGTVNSSLEKITEAGKKSANLRIVPKGTFIMAITGLEAAGTRGNCALLGLNTTLNQSCMALFPKKGILDSRFLFQWYRKVGEEYGTNYTQGTKQQSYNAELIKILPITLPNVDEQIKISLYLENLDHLITLHQNKCEELKKIKKYMLQNMFV